MNFNSHAHVERDAASVNSGLPSEAISTHTLTWSVTSKNMPTQKAMDISTHTLTWSVTEKNISDIEELNISTHTLTWSVTVSTGDECSIIIISTHTLTWSVTHGKRNLQNTMLNFNSHAHVERDQLTVLSC